MFLAQSCGLNRLFVLLCVAVLPVLVVGSAALIGETSIPIDIALKTIANNLFGGTYILDPIDAGIIWNYRLTRAVVGVCCGASLAVSGVLLQALLRNALAEPYILGISSGASTGVVFITILGFGAGAVSLSISAFGGALLAFGVVVALSWRTGRSVGAIILSGIASAQLFNAITALIVARSADAEQARAIMFWLLGDLSPVTITGIFIALWYARALDAFTFGTRSAASLGIAVARVYGVLITVCAALTATMVSMVGVIGFVGLVIPHAARFFVGARHRRLIPVSALIGAIFMVVCDVVARTIITGSVLPIGVVTALVGAPAFALILCRQKRQKPC